MSERRSYHRFPHGQTCEQCPSKRWYSEDGRRYCDRGHEIEGFIEHGFEDENAFGQTGAVARKEKEARERVVRTLSGNASRELYLQCLQLVLRKQLFWLVRDRGLPPELETVVRDLWALRTRNIVGLRTASEAERDEDVESGAEPSETEAGELRMFSSGAESDGGARTERLSSGSRATSGRTKSWSSDIGARRSLPRLIDTLALCYMGCLLMRLPVRVGDLFEWAKNNRILYLDALHEVPREMRARLPGQYHRALAARLAPFAGCELHEAVLDLAITFHAAYKLEFPPLNRHLLTLRYIRELGLPAEIYAFTQAMLDFLNADFTFPIQQRRVQLLDHPDVFLISCITMITKIICPFDDTRREAKDLKPSIPLLSMDWQSWREEFSQAPKDHFSRREVEKLKPEEAWTMSQAKVDDYLSWYQQIRVDTQVNPGDKGRLASLFPLDERPRQRDTQEGDTTAASEAAAMDEKLAYLQSKMALLSPVEGSHSEDASPGLGSMHPVWRTLDDAPPAAKAFYAKAAELSGLSPSKLARAIATLERRLGMWVKRRREDVTSEEDFK